MKNLAFYFSLFILTITLNYETIGQSIKTDAAPAEATSTYYTYAHVIVDNGTLLITDLKEVTFPKPKNDKEERQILLAFQSSNNLNFFKKVGSTYNQLMQKTLIPNSYNSVIISSNKEEIIESRNIWLSKKENNVIHIPDFEFSNVQSDNSMRKKVIIE
ncbi:hypothetical protein [Peijinzhouia sedimentorum]